MLVLACQGGVRNSSRLSFVFLGKDDFAGKRRLSAKLLNDFNEMGDVAVYEVLACSGFNLRRDSLGGQMRTNDASNTS